MADRVQDYIDAARDAIRAFKDKTADFTRGSDYESLSGASAMIWSRETQRDTDLFRAIRFLDATGDDLTDYVRRRWGIERGLATRGIGEAIFERPTVGGGEGTIWRGTRIRLLSPTRSVLYRVAVDTPVEAPSLVTAIPVEALEVGPGSGVQVNSGLRVEDPLWDETWRVVRLVCSDGTSLEEAGAFRERTKLERRAKRPGHEAAIIAACKEAGAGQVAVYRSDYGGEARDAGLNVVYVGDLGYSGSADLVRACVRAVRSVRVAGDCMQVLPMVRAELLIDADITLRDSPASLPLGRLDLVARAAILQHLNGRDGGFTYTRAGITGAIVRHIPEAQHVEFVAPGSDASVLVDGNFPASLTRYAISDANIILRYR